MRRKTAEPLHPPFPAGRPAGEDSRSKILIDFDGTLIREHFLVQWVFFILKCGRMGFGARRFFLFKALVCGGASMLLSRFPAAASLAIRIAFFAFHGTPARKVREMVFSASRRSRIGRITLNPDAVRLLADFFRERPSRELWIVSQGAPDVAIRDFLERQDVADALARAGIPPDRIRIVANHPLIDPSGRFTGHLRPPVLTKKDRILWMADHDFLIGDDGDERVMDGRVRTGKRFMNWRLATRRRSRRRLASGLNSE